MDVLTVFAQKEIIFHDHVIVPVFWRTGIHRIKALNVRLALTCNDKQSAAEVVAIRYLLGEKNIFNANRTGINLKLVVSKGSIKKMARQSTDKIDLYEYGYPILTRYSDAELVVSKDTSWFPADGTLDDVYLVDGESLRGIEKIQSDDMGLIAVTRHAMDRYGQYCGTIDMNTTWKNLHRRLKGRLQKAILPTGVAIHKLKKYGDYPEIFKHSDDPLHYVFCQKDDFKLLVTVFNRDPEEKNVFIPHLANR